MVCWYSAISSITFTMPVIDSIEWAMSVWIASILFVMSSVARAVARRELLHLVGHDGEPLAGLTGTSRLDRGIERQQVGLLGDAVDHLHDRADLVRPFAELHHAGLARTGRGDATVRDVHRIARAAGDLLDRRRELLDTGRHGLDVPRHIGRRRRRQLQLMSGLGHVVVHVAGHDLQLLGRCSERARAAGDAADIAAQIGEHLRQRDAHLADRVVARHRDGDGEIAVGRSGQRHQHLVDLALQFLRTSELTLLLFDLLLFGGAEFGVALSIALGLRRALLLQPQLLVERRVELGRRGRRSRPASRSSPVRRRSPVAARWSTRRISPTPARVATNIAANNHSATATAMPLNHSVVVRWPTKRSIRAAINRSSASLAVGPSSLARSTSVCSPATSVAPATASAMDSRRASRLVRDRRVGGRPDGLGQAGVDRRSRVVETHLLDRCLGDVLVGALELRERQPRTSCIDERRRLRGRDVHEIEGVEVGIEREVRRVGDTGDHPRDRVDLRSPGSDGVRRCHAGVGGHRSDAVGELTPLVGETQLVGDPGVDHGVHVVDRRLHRCRDASVDDAATAGGRPCLDGDDLQSEQRLDQLDAEPFTGAEVLVGLLHRDIALDDEAQRCSEHERDERELPGQAQSAEQP